MNLEALELDIERAQLRLALARGRRARERCWQELQSLLGKRTDHQKQQQNQD